MLLYYISVAMHNVYVYCRKGYRVPFMYWGMMMLLGLWTNPVIPLQARDYKYDYEWQGWQGLDGHGIQQGNLMFHWNKILNWLLLLLRPYSLKCVNFDLNYISRYIHYKSVTWNYLYLSKFQQCNCWSLGKVNNYIPYFNLIIYLCWDISQSMLVNGALP